MNSKEANTKMQAEEGETGMSKKYWEGIIKTKGRD